MSASETVGSAGSGHPDLHLTPEERQVYGKLLKEADPDGFGAVSGDIAVKFFERTKLPADVLGQIWQIADTQNRGFLTPAGFGVVLRLIGHAQSGRAPSAQLATQPAPLPKFDGQTASLSPPPAAAVSAVPAPIASPSLSSSPVGLPPIRVPPLGPDKVAEYWQLFDKSGAENGMLPGVVAKQIFERARLPNEVLGRIWALSDTRSRGALDVTEFVIAMHLLASYKSGQMRGVPSTLPPGLYEAAARRPGAARAAAPGSRPGSASPVPLPLTPQFSGQFAGVHAQSPTTRPRLATPLSAQSTGDGSWAITPADKARFDAIFATVDKTGSGYISGEQAVDFFSNARLPEEVLAQIWDLADINSEGRLTKDEFAVAMYLIRQQRNTKDGRGSLPATLPPSLVPPSRRKAQLAPLPEPRTAQLETAPPVARARSAADDLFGLDAFGEAPPTQPQVPQSTGGTDAGRFGSAAGAITSTVAGSSLASSPITATAPSTAFKPFVPSSSFGQSLQPQPQLQSQSTGSPAIGQARDVSAHDDLLGDTDPNESSKLTNETSELANLSNQVGSLSKQMTDLQSQRAEAEHELSQQTAQKRAFESRLGQLRTLYENEAQQVKALQAQLQNVRNDTKRLQTDHAVIAASHQDLASQHQQLQAQLEADQRENAALKDKIRQTNVEVEQLKPLLEKLKSEARQHKGLVAINKKQLATNEAERDRLKAELVAAQKELEDSQRGADESARQVELSKQELEAARSMHVPSARSVGTAGLAGIAAVAGVAAVAGAAVVASPASSTTSNPFFRAPTTSPPPQETARAQNGNPFDSIFGPSFSSSNTASFVGESAGQARSVDAAVPGTSNTFTTGASAHQLSDPQSVVQTTSATLPIHSPTLSTQASLTPPLQESSLTTHESSSITPVPVDHGSTPEAHGHNLVFSTPGEEQGSVRQTLPEAAASTSNHSGFPLSAADEEQESIRQTLPTAAASTSFAAPATIASGSSQDDFPLSAADEEQESIRQTLPTATAPTLAAPTSNHDPLPLSTGDDQDASAKQALPTRPLQLAEEKLGQHSATVGRVPGAFTDTPTLPAETTERAHDLGAVVDGADAADDKGKATSGSSEDAKDNFDQYFGSAAHKRTPSEQARDFDFAFASMKPGAPVNGTSGSKEFPDIQELENDDDSSVYSVHEPVLGFEDSFDSKPSAQSEVGKGKEAETWPEVVSSVPGRSLAPQFDNERKQSPVSQFPGFDATEQLGSLPGYAEAVPGDNPSNFPREDKGLLAERSVPLSGGENAATSPTPVQALPPLYGLEAVKQQIPEAAKPESPEGFDPSFDSPAQSISTWAASSQHQASPHNTRANGSAAPVSGADQFDFDKFQPPPAVAASVAAVPSGSSEVPNGRSEAPKSHDWDDIFAGISSSGPNVAAANDFNEPSTPVRDNVPFSSGGAVSATTGTIPSFATSPNVADTPKAAPRLGEGENTNNLPPPLTRAISTTSAASEHDDPILKRLTAMGWSRSESLAALEKYDYNIDKAADYLTFKS
ncbi:hypothetical protein DV738_g3143, partial [Chaetothyriales sp. CBS 135597]